MNTRIRDSRICLALATLGCLLTVQPAFPAGEKEPVKKYALLVGCTKYQNESIPELRGPTNDVLLFAGLLKENGFPDSHITTLAGWSDDAATRPTCANIVKAFDDLIVKAGPQTQIVILLAGHGTQIPIPETQLDPLDPRNPEPDGLDEVFLPADAKPWGPKRLENAILDDQIGAWLDRLQAKGAGVWIIFDCCHSGTMTRDADGGERSRHVRPGDLGVPAQAIADAVKRAQAAVKQKNVPAEVSALNLAPVKGPGSVVAFYACQSFETAPELLRPLNVDRERQQYHGLLTYSLVACLKQCQRSITYRELAQLLGARYHAERAGRGPAPFCEGDLDREVLGVGKRSTGPAITISRDDDRLQITGGELHGLTSGAVLSVHPPPGDKRDPEMTLGHIVVKQAGTVTADVEPCIYKKQTKVASSQLPTGARCKLIVRPQSTRPLKVALQPKNARDEADAAKVRLALDRLDERIRNLFDVTADAPRADWLLSIDAGQLQWRMRDRATHWSTFPSNDGARFERDLQTIFTWTNVWRIAGLPVSPDSQLTLDVATLGENDRVKDRLVSGCPLVRGQRIAYTVRNAGPQDWWVHVLMLDGNLSIKNRAFTLPARSALGPVKGTIAADSVGMEGFIVLATPQTVSRMQPSYEFLEQPGLNATNQKPRGDRARGAEQARSTAFGALLADAVLGGSIRSLSVDDPNQPVILSFSWIARPAAIAP